MASQSHVAGQPIRPLLLAAIVLVIIQAGFGMFVNLFVTVPGDHPGAHPASYLSGSFDSVVWAIGHGAGGLAVHAALGLALALVGVAVAVEAVRSRQRGVMVWSILAGLLVIGAGFNGASFLDFDVDGSSFIMALLAFAAVACYAVALFRAPHLSPVMRRRGQSASR